MIRAIEGARRKLQRKEALAEEVTPEEAVAVEERLIESLERLNNTIESRS
ncbi:MAG: hypothetical protein WBG70_01435 [Spirulinaceae cyanobacterium]